MNVQDIKLWFRNNAKGMFQSLWQVVGAADRKKTFMVIVGHGKLDQNVNFWYPPASCWANFQLWWSISYQEIQLLDVTDIEAFKNRPLFSLLASPYFLIL